MPWDKSPEDRRRDTAVYGHPEYRRNRAAALRRAGGRCELCGRRDKPLQTDHVIPVTEGGTHVLTNLQVLCSGPGSCHAAKSGREGRRASAKGSADPEPRPRTAW
jgi:5-methylcytosine-specific restriction endonuclease McrA